MSDTCKLAGLLWCESYVVEEHKRESACTCYKSLPTSSVGARFELAFGFSVFLSLLPSSAEESAILRRFSTGEETEEVLRLRRAPGTYLAIDRFLGRLGLGEPRRIDLLGIGLRLRLPL